MSRRKKIITNEQSIANLLKELDSYEVALLRERIVHIMKLTRDDITKNPEDWNHAFSNPRIYLKLADKVDQHLSFGSEPERKKRRTKKEMEQSNIQIIAKLKDEKDGTV